MSENIDYILDILDVATFKENAAELVTQVAQEHSQKVIIQDNKPAAILVNAADFQAMRNKLLAYEFRLGIEQMKLEDARGELQDWDELLNEFGINFSDEDFPEPAGYQQMIPEKYRHAS